jgi:hypothetical protein
MAPPTPVDSATPLPSTSPADAADSTTPTPTVGGRRKKNPWLAHVKATMRGHRNKSFKQVLKIAKKTYRNKSRSKHQSQNGGKKHSRKQKQQQQQQEQEQEQQQQQGGSGVGGGNQGKEPFGANAAPVA